MSIHYSLFREKLESKSIYIPNIFHDGVSSGIIPAPKRKRPKTINTTPMCSIPMLVTTCN